MFYPCNVIIYQKKNSIHKKATLPFSSAAIGYFRIPERRSSKSWAFSLRFNSSSRLAAALSTSLWRPGDTPISLAYSKASLTSWMLDAVLAKDKQILKLFIISLSLLSLKLEGVAYSPQKDGASNICYTTYIIVHFT